MSFAHMKTMINTNGSNIRQSKINDGRLLMKHQFDSDPSYRDSFYFWKFGVHKDYFDSAPIKVFGEKYSAANGLTIQFNALYDNPIVIGDMLWDKKTDLYWICVESFNKDGILYSGKLVRCVNNKMRWQDSNGKICEYPVFEINSTQYNSGESSNKTLTLGSSQHLITIIADENTIALNHGQRFFWDRNTIEPTVFKVTQNDTTASNYDKGLLKITVTEDQYNPDTDNIDLMLCDYQTVENNENNNENNTETPINITFVGEPIIRIGRTKTFKSNMATVFSLITTDLSKDKIHLTQNDDYSCKVKVDNQDILVGLNFKIIAKDENNNTSELLVEIQGGV